MRLADREEFDAIMARLFAGFDRQCGPSHSDAYFAGLSKMSLAQFARSVEFSLSEHGPERLPSPPQLWRLLKAANAQRPSSPALAAPEPDNLDLFANRLLLRCLLLGGGLGSRLSAAIVAKDLLVEFHCELIAERNSDAIPAGFIDHFSRELAAITPLAEETKLYLQDLCKVAWARQPWPPSFIPTRCRTAAAA